VRLRWRRYGPIDGSGARAWMEEVIMSSSMEVSARIILVPASSESGPWSAGSRSVLESIVPFGPRRAENRMDDGGRAMLAASRFRNLRQMRVGVPSLQRASFSASAAKLPAARATAHHVQKAVTRTGKDDFERVANLPNVRAGAELIWRFEPARSRNQPAWRKSRPAWIVGRSCPRRHSTKPAARGKQACR